VKIKYDSDLMKIMSLFESMTGAKLKDAILNDGLIFVVQENDMGKAIGKNGVNVKRLERMLKKRIRIIEFSDKLIEFVRNVVAPVRLRNISFEDGIVSLECNDTKSKGIIIGRDRKNINFLTSVLNRYFEVSEVKVV